MIPTADGDATPLGQRPLCVLPVVCRIWASVRLRHLDGWLTWLPPSVFSAGCGRGSERPGILVLWTLRRFFLA